MLITAAPAATALPIASPDAAQVMPPSGTPGVVASGTLSARAPGHTPRMPTPFCGAAATAAVAVPCALVTGVPGSVENAEPAHSGCAGSAAASTSAISGLSGVTGGGAVAGETTAERHAFGGTESGSSGTACLLLSTVLACE